VIKGTTAGGKCKRSGQQHSSGILKNPSSSSPILLLLEGLGCNGSLRVPSWPLLGCNGKLREISSSPNPIKSEPEVSSEAMVSSDNEKTTGAESGNEPQQKETRVNSSSHKNQPEDAALKATPEAREEGHGTEMTESDDIVSNDPAPKTRKGQKFTTFSQVVACAACQDDKQTMSSQNIPKLDLNGALAVTDSTSTRRS
jgi:hypothetical protein